MGGFVALSLPVLLFRINQFYPFENFPYQALDFFKTIASVLAMLHVVYVALKGRTDDMIEKRRRFRFSFVVALAAVVAIAVIGEELFYAEYKEAYNTFRSPLILLMAEWGLLWLTKVHPKILAFEALQPLAATPMQIDPRDKLLHEALLAQMETHKLYAQPGLTIQALSEHLGAPEHHVRKLINQGLGYRNFSSFLNQYRVEAVKAEMAKPENSRLPVLTMAMDVGYNSLAPFNRAFKSVTGVTPTTYRRDLLGV